MRTTIFNPLDNVQATISNGQSLSGGINLGGLRLFGLVIPSAWTAANITFQMSVDNGSTWNNVYDQNGNEVTVTAGASRFITVDPVIFPAVQWIQVRSGTSATPVTQGADRNINLILRSV